MNDGNIFRFKHFAIDQNGCAMKVGTDGVLLGAWCRVERSKDESILDIGTGTGVIALQLAQRTSGASTVIEAVEIDPAACDAARRNFEASEWSDRLVAHCMSIWDFAFVTSKISEISGGSRESEESEAPPPNGRQRLPVSLDSSPPETIGQPVAGRLFDHIVSNPPYFVNSLSSPDASRNLARHSYSLSYDDLMKCCFRLLKPRGRISLILPAGVETKKMTDAAETRGFVVSRRTEVHSTPKSGPKRTLLEFSRAATTAKSGPKRTLLEFSRTEITNGSTSESIRLTIEGDKPGTFSEEYRALTRDFYLYF